MAKYTSELSTQRILKELGELLSRLRANAGKGQTESAKYAKTNRMQIWRYESGITLPSHKKIRALLKFYRASKLDEEIAIGLFNQCAEERLQIPKKSLSKNAMLAFGCEVRALRNANELYQHELAKIIGLPQSEISKMENGLFRPKECTMEKLVNALSYRTSHRIRLWRAWRRCIPFNQVH